MHQRPADRPPSDAPDGSDRAHSRSARLAWLLPALPLVAALFVATWPLPSAATGVPSITEEAPPAEVLRAAFPGPSFAAPGQPIDAAWIASRTAPADALSETYDLLVRDFAPRPEAPSDAESTPAPAARPSVAGPPPTPVPTPVPTAVPTPIATPLPTATPAPTATPRAGPPPVASVDLSPRESLLLDAMNAVRAEAGLSILVPRDDLTSVARARSEEMVRLDYFAHFYPGGRSAYELLAAAGVTFSAAGENLVKTYGDIDESVTIGFEALMNSSGHRDNILKPAYTRVGVGSFTSDDGVTIITTVFTDR